MVEMAKRVTFGISDWAEYVEFKIRNGLPVEEGFTLSMLEMEVPFQRLGFETFSEFLQKHVPNVNQLVKEPLNKERCFIPIECSGELRVGCRVIWFGTDSTTFKGTVKWLGSIERILCAGVFTDEKVGSPFPIVWKSSRLFFTPPGHSLIMRVNELILKSDYAQRQTSLLSRTLSKLMRKVSIRERPREVNLEDITVDPQKLRQFDVIYPYAVDFGPNGLKVNDTVIWSNNAGNFIGIVKWLGHLNCQSGLTVGIEFKTAVGSSSGTFEGHKLFESKPNHGKFLCVKCIRKLEQSQVPPESGLMSTPTFDFTNQDLSLTWHRNQHLPRQFDIGDAVLYQRDSNSYYTGSIQWLGSSDNEVVGIRFDTPLRNSTRSYTEPIPLDCPSEVSDIVPVEKLVSYNRVIPDRSDSPPPSFSSPLSQINALAARRLSNRNRTHNPTARASHEWFPQKGVITPCIQPERLKRLIGYKRGIQGKPNSSHMDALLFAIFSCSETFDKILLQTKENDPLTTQILKEILRTEIANRLRRKSYCSATNIQAVAQVFSSCELTILPGKSDQILETLLQKVSNPAQVNPTITYQNGAINHVHRIISSSSNFSENIVTVQKLLETDMKLQNLQFQNQPNPALVIVLPERNEELAPSKLFIPSLTLDLNNLMSLTHPSPESSSNPCTLCGENSSTECADCDDLVVSDPGSDSSANVFCVQCFDVFHQHWTRRNHNKRIPSADKKGKILELQSVICTRENQSIAFVKCGGKNNAEWIVHDSVCDGSSPQVQNVFSLADCLQSLEKEPSSVVRDWTSFIPEVKIILSFAHICVYAAPTVESSGAS